MPRYIDAEALMQKLCKQCGVKDKEYFCHAHCGDRMNIENIPTADVQPVRYGKWISHGGNSYECSNCHKMIYNAKDMREHAFCGTCGSKNGR